ncbi:hypothetical protein KO527_24040 [Pseudoalteromonas sp. C2R02]|uniref:hypothetical protein n=1 Tax=Pseudoalteromonas sp. C2R02 TaxID=2841565 RepID=UPI001C08A039|nr:hypothetical protein [Pseudoalteromonas sp. C2R02]MBU2972409.1 hypothetical protein [Pseudoalteromonas sp. C2R02]
MDPITGFLLSLSMIIFRGVIDLITLPFNFLKKAFNNHPLRAARFVIGSITAGMLSYLFGLPYQVEITFSSGIFTYLIGEII